MSLDLHLYAEIDLGEGEPTWLPVPQSERTVTHNLTPMWHAAGCYEALYASDNTLAGDHLPVLRRALRVMQDHRKQFKALEPENAWGTYEGALAFLQVWIAVCSQYPKARVRSCP